MASPLLARERRVGNLSEPVYGSKMSVEQLESAIRALPARELRRLARWFDDHRHELLPGSQNNLSDEIESSQKREVLARLAETDSSPDKLQSFEKTDLDQMIQEITHAHRQKAPPG